MSRDKKIPGMRPYEGDPSKGGEVLPGLGWMADLDAWLEQNDVVGVALGDVVLVGLPQDVEDVRNRLEGHHE